MANNKPSFDDSSKLLYYALAQTRFNYKYIGNVGDITLLGSYLNSIPQTDQFGKLFNSPEEYIVSVKAYPFDLKKLSTGSTTSEYVVLGKETTTLQMKTLDVIKPSFNLGTYTFTPRYNYSYLDYAPFTKITVWLPYMSFVELDTNEVMGKTVSFDYAIDLDSGEVTAVISVISDDGDPYVIKTINGKIGIDIPLGSTNAREIQKQFIQSTIGLVGGTIAMTNSKGFGTAMGIGMISKGTQQMFNALQTHYEKGNGSLQGKNNLPLPQCIYVIYERNDLIYSPVFTKGKPLMEEKNLGTISGYTECDSMVKDMNLSFATKDEADEIKNLLISGIYLP